MNILAKNLKFLREAAGLSIRDLADAAGVSVEDYLAWERSNALPQAEQLKKLTDFYELDIKEMFSKTFIEDYIFVHPEAEIFDPDNSDYQGEADQDFFEEEEAEEEEIGEEGFDDEEADEEEFYDEDQFDDEELDNGEFDEGYDEEYEEYEEEPEERKVSKAPTRRNNNKPASRYLDADEEVKKPPRVRAHARDDGEYVAIEREMYVPIGRKSTKKTSSTQRKRTSKTPKGRARVARARDSQSPLWEQVVSNERIRRMVLEEEDVPVVQKQTSKPKARSFSKRDIPVEDNYQGEVVSSEEIDLGVREYDMTAYDMPDMSADPDLFKTEFKQLDYDAKKPYSKNVLPYDSKNETGTFDTDTGDRTDLTSDGGTSLNGYFEDMTASSGSVEGDEVLAENKESDYLKEELPEQEDVQQQTEITEEPVKPENEDSKMPDTEGWTVVYQDNRVVNSEEELNTPIEGQQSLFEEDGVSDDGFLGDGIIKPEQEELNAEQETEEDEKTEGFKEEVASYDLGSLDEKPSEQTPAVPATAEVVIDNNKKPQYIKNIFTTNDNPIAIAICLSIALLLSLFLPMVRGGGQSYIGFALISVDIVRGILAIALALLVVAFLIDILVVQYKVLAAQNIVDKRFAKTIKRNSIIYAVLSLAIVVALLVLSLDDFELGMIVLGVIEIFFVVACIMIVALTKRVKVGTKKRAIIKHKTYQMQNSNSKKALLIGSIITMVLWVLVMLFVVVGVVQAAGGQNVLQQIGIVNDWLWWIAELFAGFAGMLLGNYILIALMFVVLLGIFALQISNISLYKKLVRNDFDKKSHTLKELKSVRRHGITNLSVGAGLYVMAMAIVLGLIFGDYQNTWFAYEYGVLIILTVISLVVVYKLTIYIRLYKCFEPIDGGDAEPQLWLSFDEEGEIKENYDSAAGPVELEKILKESSEAKKSFAEARKNLALNRENLEEDALSEAGVVSGESGNYEGFQPDQGANWAAENTMPYETQAGYTETTDNIIANTEPFTPKSEEVMPNSYDYGNATYYNVEGAINNDEYIVQQDTLSNSEYNGVAEEQTYAENTHFASETETLLNQQKVDSSILAETEGTQVASEPNVEEVKVEQQAENQEDILEANEKLVKTKSKKGTEKKVVKTEDVALEEASRQSTAEVIEEVIKEETAEKDTIDDILDRIEKEINNKGKANKGGDK